MNRAQWIALVVGAIIIAAAVSWGIVSDAKNQEYHFKTIQVKGVVCPVDQDFGYIQDTNEVVYDIPTRQCKVQPVGQVIDITYHHIHNPYALSDEWDFNTIVVGDL